MKGKMYHFGHKRFSIDAAGVDFQVWDDYILLIITSITTSPLILLLLLPFVFALKEILIVPLYDNKTQ